MIWKSDPLGRLRVYGIVTANSIPETDVWSGVGWEPHERSPENQDVRVAPDLGPKAGLLANCSEVHMRCVRKFYGELSMREFPFTSRKPYFSKAS